MERRKARTSSSFARRSCVAPAALLALAAAARAQETRWTAVGTYLARDFGNSVAWVGDWDGDGLQDFAVASPINDRTFTPQIVVLSSATRMPLLVFSNDRPQSSLGINCLLAIGDVDGDGRTDLVTSSLERRGSGGSDSGEVASWDSAGHKRWTWPPARGSVATANVVGDLDGDAILDLGIRRSDSLKQGGFDVVSGATGQLIRTHPEPSVGAWSSVSGALDDVDLDGVPDYFAVALPLVVGVPDDLVAFSGATGQQLWLAHFRRSSSIVAVDDVDQDGIGDVVYFSPDLKKKVETGWVLSGASGTVVRDLGGDDYIQQAVVAGDLDGDGVGDVVGASGWRPGVELVAYSPVTGLEIGHHSIGSQKYCEDLDGSVDFDGDGHVDLLCGIPKDWYAGWVKVVGLAGWTDLLQVDGDLLNTRELGDATALVPDRDGDGAPEILASTLGDVGGAGNHVKVLSSRDGRELARVAVAGGISRYFLPLIGVPDVDGDHVDDWLFAAADGTVEVRSGRDDALIQTWSLSAGEPNFVAAGIDAAGHSIAAISTFQAPDKAEIAIRDLTTGASPPYVKKSKRFSSVACLGDLDGDGVLDWIACDTGVANCRLTAYSGANGATIWTRLGGATAQHRAVWRIDDLTGDGKDDVLVLIDNGIAMFQKVVARDGMTGAQLFELPDPMVSSTGFGAAMAGLGDLDHDGWCDFAVGAGSANHNDGFVDLYSGRTARLLRRIDGATGSWFGFSFATLARGASMHVPGNGHRRPALVANSPFFGGFPAVGRVDLVLFSDLFLEIDPPLSAEGGFVVAATRGGAPGSLAGLYLVAIDGVAVDQFGEFGVLDSFGEWTTSDVVPPGLSGTVFTLRSYAVGLDGKLSFSTAEMLTIW